MNQEVEGSGGGPEPAFDVILIHKIADRKAVQELAQALRNRGKRPWLEEEHTQSESPVMRFRKALDTILPQVSAAAILVGGDGKVPWQDQRKRLLLERLLRRQLPVVPVLLPGARTRPTLPALLQGSTWLDLRSGLTPDGIDRLQFALEGRSQDSGELGARSEPPQRHNLPFKSLGVLLQHHDESLAMLGRELELAGMVLLRGPAGIGKTRLAIEYAWQSGAPYQAVLYVRADSPELLGSRFAALAAPGVLGLPEWARGDSERRISDAVLAWLRAHPYWLLILDDVDSDRASKMVTALLRRLGLLGGRGTGHVLVVSRQQRMKIRTLELPPLRPDEALRYLLERSSTGREEDIEDERFFELAALLAQRPLAMEQAGAYIAARKISLDSYMAAWDRTRTSDHLSVRSEQQWPEVLIVTLEQTIRQLGPAPVALLRLLSLFASGPIPVAMIEQGKRFIEEAASRVEATSRVDSPLKALPAVAVLEAYSLIQRHGPNLSVHRPVQEITRGRIPDVRAWVGFAVELLDSFCRSVEEPLWPAWDALRPHLLEVIAHVYRVGITGEAARWLKIRLDDLLGPAGAHHPADRLGDLLLNAGSDVLGQATSAATDDLAAPDEVASPADLPQPLDGEGVLRLAFRLVAARRVSPDLLLHLDDARLREAAESVLASIDPDGGSPPSRLRAAAELLAGQLPDALPDPLWQSWMLATQGKHLEDLAAGITATASSSSPPLP